MTLDPRRWRVGTKIAIALVSFSVLPLLLLANAGSNRLRDQAQADGKQQLSGLAVAVASGLDAELRANIELVSGIARNQTVVAFSADPAARDDLGDALQAEFDALADTHPSAGIFFVLDQTGVAIASSDRAILGKSYAFRPYFQQAMQGITNVSDVYLPIGTTSGVPGTAFATPIRAGGTTGPVVGAAVIKSDALTVSKSLSNRGGRRAFIVEQSGIISSHPDPRLRFTSLRRLSPEEQQAAADARRFNAPVPSVRVSPSIRALVGSTRPGFSIGSLDGVDVAAAWSPLAATSWTAVATEPLGAYSAAANAARRDALVAAAVVALVVAVLAFGVARRLSRPITVLTDGAVALEQGTTVDEAALASVGRRRDDLGALATRLGDAARESRSREERLQAQVEALRVQIDQTRRRQDVEAIVESDSFADIKARAEQMRRRVRGEPQS